MITVISDELERPQKEMFIVEFKVLFQNLTLGGGGPKSREGPFIRIIRLWARI